jgi:hypothetical protein
MRTIKKEFAALTKIIRLETLYLFPKKEMDSIMKSIFFSVIPTCSLRFPIAATRGKAIECSTLICNLKAMEVNRVKSYIKTVNVF